MTEDRVREIFAEASSVQLATSERSACTIVERGSRHAGLSYQL